MSAGPDAETMSKDSFGADDEKATPPNGSQQSHDVSEEKADAPPAPPPNAGPGPVPNGGLVAWSQVLGSWMLFFNTWGILK